MINFHRLLAACLVLAVAIIADAARAETVRITFVLVNDIYQMDDQLMADGKRRGGYARLATVIKAERAKSRHVVFAHAGDMLSPSLMSGFDQGAHIIALTNMIRPDMLVPGNHEFDFGKAVFLKRMAEAKFPRFAANLRGPERCRTPSDGASCPVNLAAISGVARQAKYLEMHATLNPTTSSPVSIPYLTYWNVTYDCRAAE